MNIPPRILIVDDQPDNVELLEQILEDEEYDTLTAYEAQEALDIVKEETPDLILLDIMMPDVDGFEVCSILKSDENTRKIPIIFVTAKTETVDKVKGLELGAVDYITKPFEEAEVLARVRTQIKLKTVNDEKNQFLGMAAHDLRTPLNLILMNSQLMHSGVLGELNEKQIKFFSIIESSSEFMVRLIDDLLDISKIESGKLELNLQSTDLISLVKHNVELNSVLAEEKQIELLFSYDEHLPKIMIDAHKIEQVLNNLISNAIKFSYPQSTIEIHVTRSENNAVISVRDKGQGIPADELDKLFKPFEKSSVKGTEGEKSTGLGLIIVRKIVEGHQGEIWVESEVGKGATFYVSLPINH